MITKIFKSICAICVICGFVSCSSSEDPFFTAGEDDDPRILNTDLPEGSAGEPAVIKNIERTTNFTYEVMVTPVHYTTVTWFIDGQQVADGLTIDVPVLAGDHILQIVATTVKGKSTSRTCKLVVRPAAGDPELAGDAKSRWLTIGTTKTIDCANVENVTKVFIGGQEASNVSYANGKLTFDIPTMEEGEYMVSIEDESGMRYGCGLFTVSSEAYVDPGVKETVLWEGDIDINWGTSNVTVSAEALANVAVGTTIRLVYEMIEMPDGYHAMRITTPWWGDNAEDQVVAQFDLTAETPNPFEFTYTEANKAIVDERGGMLIVGYGYKLTKVLAVENVAPAETIVWQGSVDINWGESNVQISAEEMAAVPVGAKINMYYEMIDMPDGYHAMRVTTPWWGDNAEDQVVAQFDLSADTPNPFEFTYTEANKAIVDERGGMLIVGYGYKLTKVTYAK
ncbi:MAG: hypothetical protein IKZ48_09435 [Prevotella sp.]|nr:hypothetical protein [Prevotella sp.]